MNYWVRTRDEITKDKNEELVVFVWSREELEASVGEKMTDSEWYKFLDKVRNTNEEDRDIPYTKAMRRLYQADVDLETSLFDLVDEVKK